MDSFGCRRGGSGEMLLTVSVGRRDFSYINFKVRHGGSIWRWGCGSGINTEG